MDAPEPFKPTNPTKSAPATSPDATERATQFASEAALEPTLEPAPEGEKQRLSKLLSAGGIASRRAAEDMISEGRVAVNGHIIREQGFKADPLNDKIVVDGHPLKISTAPKSVVLLHKPKNVMTTRDDPGRRSTIFELLPKKFAHFHSVGRLDFDTSGVLLLTDDGDLTHLLTHPSHGAEKVYEARVRGEVSDVDLEKLRRGVQLDDGPTAPCRARVVAQREKNALVELTLREGRNRQVRRMLEAVGHPVSALRRVKFAGVELEGLLPGEHRALLTGEVKALRKRVEKKVKIGPPKPPRRPTRTKSAKKPVGKPTEKPAEKLMTRKSLPTSPTARRVAEKWRDS